MWRTHCVGRLAGIAVVGLLVGNSLAARAGDEPAAKEIAPALIPGGVADPDGKLAYVANPKGGLDVLRLTTGELLWTTPEVRRPLIVAAGRLIVEAPVKDHPKQFVLAVYNATQAGGILLRSEPLSFPDWVSIDSDLANSFATQCHVEGDALIVRWRADARYIGEATTSPAADKEAQRKAASGEIRMDLKTGKTAMKLDDKPVELTGPAEPRDAAIGAYHLLLDESAEGGVGFSRNIKRSLRATDGKSDKVLWEHNLAPEVIIPAAK